MLNCRVERMKHLDLSAPLEIRNALVLELRSSIQQQSTGSTTAQRRGKPSWLCRSVSSDRAMDQIVCS